MIGLEAGADGLALVIVELVGLSSDSSAFGMIDTEELALPLAALLFLLELGLVWILECLVSSSDRENRLVHPGNVQTWGFSPVWVRMCLV